MRTNRSPRFEVARVLVRFDHVASRIVKRELRHHVIAFCTGGFEAWVGGQFQILEIFLYKTH